MGFHVIAVADGLSDSERSRAVEAGPPEVSAPADYPTLLDSAGFDAIRLRDVSASYRETAAAWLREWTLGAEGLAPLFGPKEYAEAQSRRRRALAAIDEGILERYLITARAR